MGIGFIWPLILGFGILFFPETPRYDFRKGRVDRAKKTMETMYGVSVDHWVIYKELEEIKAKLSAESRDKKGVWGDMVEMFTAPRMFYRISLGILLQMFQQLTGANYFFYYGTLIFQGVEISPFVTQMILNGKSHKLCRILTDGAHSYQASTLEPHSSVSILSNTTDAASHSSLALPGCSSAS